MARSRNPREKRDVLDWSGDDVVAWTKPKWYEKTTIIAIFTIIEIYIWTNYVWWIGLFSLAVLALWYWLLLQIIEDVKSSIIARRIYRAAERRWKAKYALPRMFEEYPWLYQYLKECRRSEEMGWLYVPDIIIRDPATEIEIRRPPPQEWTIPITPLRQITRQPEERREEQPQLPSQQPPHPPQQQTSPQPRETPRTQETPGEEVEETPFIDVEGEIYILLKHATPEQLHTLFRIIADSKGYGRLPVEIVAQQLGGLWHRTTITRYYEGRIPTRQGPLEQFKRKLQVILRRELRYNTENFEIMRRLADEHPEFAENVEMITRMLLRTEEEEEEAETQEEATEEQQQEHPQQQEQTTSPNA